MGVRTHHLDICRSLSVQGVSIKRADLNAAFFGNLSDNGVTAAFLWFQEDRGYFHVLQGLRNAFAVCNRGFATVLSTQVASNLKVIRTCQIGIGVVGGYKFPIKWINLRNCLCELTVDLVKLGDIGRGVGCVLRAMLGVTRR